MRRHLALVATCLLPLALLSACGDSDEPAASSASTPTASPTSGTTSTPTASPTSGTTSAGDPVVVSVSVKGDTISPNGDRVEVEVGQPIELDVTADAPGEVHVHSSPEQELEYDAGTTTLTIAPITTPGIVDVESHTLAKTIVQLQVQ